MISPCVLPHHDDNETNVPSKSISLLFVLLLIIIHTLDMLLTREYVGNDWTRETFLPMSLCIKYIGIYNSLWVSRIIIYSLLFKYMLNWKSRAWYSFLVAGTALYWTAMAPWLFSLGILHWP